MRLQKKLLHKILRYAEENAKGQRLAPPEFECYDKNEINYHIGLCYEAGFLHVFHTPGSSISVDEYAIKNLTWAGHLELEERKYACQD